MGLDFSHGDAHWSYGGFHKFRLKLAKLAGIPITENSKGFICWDLDHENDDIMLLLNHSDCDGILTPVECSKIIPRLEYLLSICPVLQKDNSDQELLDSIRECVKLNENLQFS